MATRIIAGRPLLRFCNGRRNITSIAKPVQHIRLPRLETRWRWPRSVNPHLPQVEEDCLRLSAGFSTFDPKTHALVHEKGKLNLLAAMCYSDMSKDELRSGCDLMHVFFMFDEHSDRASSAEIHHQAHAMVHPLEAPDEPRPETEWAGGELTRQFWLRIPRTATGAFRRRFYATWVDYVQSVVRQAQYRSQSIILGLEDFLEVRRHTSGAPSTIAMYEMHLDIPDAIRAHPVIRELETLAVDLIVIANDILSYNKEQAIGDDEHNIITILRKQHNLALQPGIDMAGELADVKMDRFDFLYSQVPRLFDGDAQRLVDGMAKCVSGVMHWSYETERYFGKKGTDVKKSRMVQLLPRVKAMDAIGPTPVDDVLIA